MTIVYAEYGHPLNLDPELGMNMMVTSTITLIAITNFLVALFCFDTYKKSDDG